MKTIKENWKLNTTIILGAVGIFIFSVIIYFTNDNLPYSSDWTGFAPHAVTLNNNVQYIRAKTFWDLLELIVVPLILALGLYWLNQSARKSERDIAKEKKEQETIEAYFDKMTELIFDKDLSKFDIYADNNGEKLELARTIAITRTLSVLRSLDAKRVSAVFRFIDDAGLKEIISFKNQNLRKVNWSEADLYGANLEEANLDGANLERAYLEEANLIGAQLPEANLQEAYLRRANLTNACLENACLRNAYLSYATLEHADLRKANLKWATLHGAKMAEADMERAYLRGAKMNGADMERVYLRGANLKGAKGFKNERLMEAYSLDDATMPDGTKYEEWIEKHPELVSPSPDEDI